MGGLQVSDNGKMFGDEAALGGGGTIDGERQPSLVSHNVGSMDKKVVLITGCSSGIGLSLAVRLASDPEHTFKGEWQFIFHGNVGIARCASG